MEEEGEKLKDRPTGPTYGEEKSLTFNPLPFGKGEERRTTTRTCRYARRMRALPISQRQKLFAHYLIVFDGVDAHLGHLHSFL